MHPRVPPRFCCVGFFFVRVPSSEGCFFLGAGARGWISRSPFLKPTQNPTPNRPELETDQRGSAGVCLHSDSRKNSELRKHIRRFQNNRTAMRVAWIKNKRRTTSKRALALQIEIESNSRGAATAQLQIRSRSEPRVHSNHRYQPPPRRPGRRFGAATPRTYRRKLWTFRAIRP